MTSLRPTGTCWCGCGERTTPDAFFVSGHDKRAEAAVVNVEYGSVPDFLERHGYGPKGLRNARDELLRYQRQGGEYL